MFTPLRITILVAGLSMLGCQSTKDMLSGTSEESTTANTENAVDAAEASAEEAMGSVTDGAADAMDGIADEVAMPEDLGSLLDSDLSVDGLKSKVAEYSPAELTDLTEGVANKLEGQMSMVDSLKGQIDQVSNLGGSVTNLQEQLQTAMASTTDLQSKLGVMVESLQSSGIDVSKFMNLLK